MNHRIRLINLETKLVTTLIGDGYDGDFEGSALECSIGFPRQLAIDFAGNVFITLGSGAVCRWDAFTGRITACQSCGLTSMTLHAGNVTKIDQLKDRVVFACTEN